AARCPASRPARAQGAADPRARTPPTRWPRAAARRRERPIEERRRAAWDLLDKWLNQYTISSPHATRGAVPRRLFAAKPAHGWPSLRSRRAPHRSPAISRRRRAWLGVGPVGRADLSPRWVTIGAIGSRLGTESPRWVAIPPI